VSAAQTARKLLGAWYTPPELVDAVVDNVLRGFRPPRGRAVRVLDPACGDGRFLFAVAVRLVALFVLGAGFTVMAETLAQSRAQRICWRGGRVETAYISFWGQNKL